MLNKEWILKKYRDGLSIDGITNIVYEDEKTKQNMTRKDERHNINKRKVREYVEKIIMNK